MVELLNAVADFLQLLFDSIEMITLNLKRTILDHTAGAAGVLDLLEQIGQIIRSGQETRYDSHHFAFGSFLNAQFGRLLRRWFVVG